MDIFSSGGKCAWGWGVCVSEDLVRSYMREEEEERKATDVGTLSSLLDGGRSIRERMTSLSSPLSLSLLSLSLS